MAFEKGMKKPEKAGRRKGTPNKKTHQRRVAESKALSFIKKKILKKFEPLIDAKIKLALGVKVLKTIPGTTHKVVYEEPPDSRSLEYLLSLVVGKPTENMNMNVQGELNIPKIEFVYEGKGNGKNGSNGKNKDKGNGKNGKRKAKK